MRTLETNRAGQPTKECSRRTGRPSRWKFLGSSFTSMLIDSGDFIAVINYRDIKDLFVGWLPLTSSCNHSLAHLVRIGIR